MKATRSPHQLLSPMEACALVAIISLSFAGTIYVARTGLQMPQMAAVIASTLVKLANNDRADQNLGSLTVNEKLIDAAQAKADDMASKSYFSHTSPDGRSSWSWFKDAGYEYAYAGENLAVDFTDSKDVEEAWLASPTHRANLLNGKYTEVGIATAVGTYKGRQTTFVVQMFGTPRIARSGETGTASALPSPVVASLAPESAPTSPVVAGVAEEPAPKPTQEVAGADVSDDVTTNIPAPVEPASVTAAPADAVTESLAEESTMLKTAVVSPLASPKSSLRTVYLVLAAMLVLAVAFRAGFEIKRHHAKHVAFAGALLVVMLVLFIAADRFAFTDPVITPQATMQST